MTPSIEFGGYEKNELIYRTHGPGFYGENYTHQDCCANLRGDWSGRTPSAIMEAAKALGTTPKAIEDRLRLGEVIIW